MKIYRPCLTIRITSKFGWRDIGNGREWHKGLDISPIKKIHEPIIAVADGVVTSSYYSKSGGNMVIIKHDNFITRYLHLNERKVQKGISVNAGNIIGTMGTTGGSTGEHLHFDIFYKGEYIDPMLIMFNDFKIIEKGELMKIKLSDGRVIEAVDFNGKRYALIEDIDNYLPKMQNIVKESYYEKQRHFETDVHVYFAYNHDTNVDFTLGKYGQLEKLSDMQSALCKINGGFFDTRGTTENLGVFIKDGLWFSHYPNDAFIEFIMYEDGTTEVKNIENLSEVVDIQLAKGSAIGSSYALVIDSKINLLNADHKSHAHSKWRNPRTMFGSIENGYVLVVADGRSKWDKGLTAKQQAEIMLKLGCINAVNLDGGGSSEIMIDNKVVNSPSDGQERRIGSAIIATRKGVQND